MSVDIIVNPVHREALDACSRVRGLCERAGASTAVRTTSIARPHAGPDPEARLTVVIGGDGTLREVAGALLRQPRWCGAVLPVPTGTASLFALNAGVRTREEGIDLLAAHLRSTCQRSEEAPTWALIRSDVGWAEIRRAEGQATSALPFLVSAGIGHSGSTILRTPRWAKALFGAAGYAAGAIGRLGARPVSVRHCADPDARTPEAPERVWAVEFGNIAQIPAGVTVFPHGGVGTGSLACLLVSFPGEGAGDTSRLCRLRSRIPGWGRVVWAGLRGGHDRVDELRLWSSQTAHVVADRPLAAHLDGESLGMVTDLRLRLVPAQLPLVVPVRTA